MSFGEGFGVGDSLLSESERARGEGERDRERKTARTTTEIQTSRRQ